MVANAPSGMYKCTKCGNIKVHIHGKGFEPCSHCASSEWVIIEKDPDLFWATPVATGEAQGEDENHG